MHVVLVTNFKSNKAPTFQQATFTDIEEGRERVQALVDSSVDVHSVEVFEYLTGLEKVETTQWR